MDAAERTEALWEAVSAGMAGQQTQRDGFTLSITRGPRVVAAGDGRPGGVEVWVSLRGPDGLVDIDPHRLILNPPLRVVTAPEVVDGSGKVTQAARTRQAPAEALWEALWLSVREHPAPLGPGAGVRL